MWHTMQKAIKGTSSLNDGEVRLPLRPTMIESAGENKPENHQVSTLETCGGERSSMRSWVTGAGPGFESRVFKISKGVIF